MATNQINFPENIFLVSIQSGSMQIELVPSTHIRCNAKITVLRRLGRKKEVQQCNIVGLPEALHVPTLAPGELARQVLDCSRQDGKRLAAPACFIDVRFAVQLFHCTNKRIRFFDVEVMQSREERRGAGRAALGPIDCQVYAA